MGPFPYFKATKASTSTRVPLEAVFFAPLALRKALPSRSARGPGRRRYYFFFFTLKPAVSVVLCSASSVASIFSVCWPFFSLVLVKESLSVAAL